MCVEQRKEGETLGGSDVQCGLIKGERRGVDPNCGSQSFPLFASRALRNFYLCSILSYLS